MGAAGDYIGVDVGAMLSDFHERADQLSFSLAPDRG
jgi:hypothetical protein